MSMHSSLRTKPRGIPARESRTCKGQRDASRRKREIKSGKRKHRDFRDWKTLPYVDPDRRRMEDRMAIVRLRDQC